MVKLQKVFLVLLLFLAGTGFYCRRTTPIPHNITLIGRIVYFGCSTDMIQVLSANLDSIKVTTWKDPRHDTTYTNVFSVRNFCYFRNFGLGEKDLFTFRIDDTITASNCVECLIADPAASIYHSVDHVMKIK